LLHLQGGNVFRGALALVIGAASTALANVIIKSKTVRFDPAMMAGWQMLFGVVPLGILGFYSDGNPLSLHWTRSAVLSLLYLIVVGSCTAFCLFYWLINRISVNNVQTIALITPIIAVSLGWFAGNERLSGASLVGSALVLSGISLILRSPPATSGSRKEKSLLVIAPTAGIPLRKVATRS
jgi:drug/metabolite transporter (DMT)-like permease